MRKKLVNSTKGQTRGEKINRKCGENRQNEMVKINPNINNQTKY